MSIEPIPPELQQLLDAEPPARLPAEVEARLLRRLSASTELAFTEAAPSPAVPSHSAPSPSAPAHSAPAPSAPLAGLGGGAALFLTGALMGALLHAQFAAPVVREIVSAPAPVAPLAPAPAPVPVAEPVPVPVPVPVPTTPQAEPPKPGVVQRAPTTPPAPEQTGLERERRLLEPARTALTRGMATQALTLLEQHAKEFPSGELAEEREALGVQALAVSGAMDAARARAKAFTARFPDSLFLPVVERAVRGD